jgi:hypothetical protein
MIGKRGVSYSSAAQGWGVEPERLGLVLPLRVARRDRTRLR